MLHKFFCALLFSLVANFVLAKPHEESFETYAVQHGLIHYWGFENSGNLGDDSLGNSDAKTYNMVTWVPAEHSFTFNSVIHLHGEKSEDSMIRIPYHANMNQGSFTLDFWFGAGTHAIDPADHLTDRGILKPGILLKWGNVKVDLVLGTENNPYLRCAVGDSVYETPTLSGFGYYQLTLAYNSIKKHTEVWIDCVNYTFLSGVPDTRGQSLQFGGKSFSGRINDVKFYNRRLRGWEITQNGYAEKGLSVKLNEKLKVKIWANEKKNTGE